MDCGFNCSAPIVESCYYLGQGLIAECNETRHEEFVYFYENGSQNCTENDEIDYERGLTALLIFVVSLIGNICTIALLSRFKIHKIPDVLVIGLAITDLVATFIPVPMSVYAYFSGYRFQRWDCLFYATVAQFTRYASVIIVTVVAVERYLAVIHPFFYRKYASPKKVAFTLIICWLIAILLAIPPAFDPCTAVVPHHGFCLFEIASNYALVILAYGVVQYIIVLYCFIAVIVQLAIVYRRRQKLKVQGKYNKQSNAQERQHEIKFTKPNLTSRISDLSKSLRKAAPLISEKFQFGVEAQFALMLLAVVVLFYATWTTILTLIVLARIEGSGESLEEALFWGIRLSVSAIAINPLMYGILARQYRLAYWYVIKMLLSKCCRCVSPPLKDVFAAARAPAGDLRSETSQYNRRSRFKQGQNGSLSESSLPGSMWSSNSTGAILTRTTNTHTHVTHTNDLDVIEELDYSGSPDSIIEEHSTFIPSVGELASTVIIPHQVRDKNSDVDLTKNALRATASLDNLVDGLISDFGYSQDIHPGIENPLIDVLSGGEMSSSEQGSAEEGFQVGQLYNNPVYQIELARRQSERLSSLVAASSADNITLVSKVPLKKPGVGSTLAATNTTNNHARAKSMDQTLVPDQTDPWSTLTGHVPVGNKDPEKVPSAKDTKADKNFAEDKRLDHLKRLQPLSRSQEFKVAESKRPKNIKAAISGVEVLRMKYETPLPSDARHTSHTLAPPASPRTHSTPSQPKGKSGRCNSTGNSDSGRESMVLETDV